MRSSCRSKPSSSRAVVTDTSSAGNKVRSINCVKCFLISAVWAFERCLYATSFLSKSSPASAACCAVSLPEPLVERLTIFIVPPFTWFASAGGRCQRSFGPLGGRRRGGALRNCSPYWRTMAAAGRSRMPTSPLAPIKVHSAAMRRTTSSAVSGRRGGDSRSWLESCASDRAACQRCASRTEPRSLSGSAAGSHGGGPALSGNKLRPATRFRGCTSCAREQRSVTCPVPVSGKPSKNQATGTSSARRCKEAAAACIGRRRIRISG